MAAAIPPPPVPVADSQPSPLTRYALQDINTPCQTDGFYVELVSREDPAYQRFTPMARGTPYATVPGADSRIVARYTGNQLYFLKQTADIDSMRVMFNSQYDNYVLWIWATQTLSQDSYNSRITYVDESVDVPRFERVSTVKRDVWERNPTLAYESTLTAMIGAKVFAPGTGYGALDANGNVIPTIGTLGNAMALGVVGTGGAIVSWVVVVEGSGITDAGSLVITGSGTGASATAIVQPVAAILLHQEKRELADSDPLSHDYVEIVNVWETVPGVALSNIKWDSNSNTFPSESKQKKLKSAITPGASIITIGGDPYVQIITQQDIDDNTAYEIVTLLPPPEAHNLATAVESTKYAPFQFPATLDTTLYSESSGVLGYNPAFTRIVKHQTKTYFVVSASEPDITSIMEDLTTTGGVPILGSIFGLLRQGGSLAFGTVSEIIYDAVELVYNSLVIDWPGSDPDLTTYEADWVGDDDDPRAVIGSVQGVNGKYFLWEVNITFVKFLIPPVGVIPP